MLAHCSGPWRTDDDRDKVEQLVLARMDRQRIFDRPKPPSFWAVLDEGVLRRRIGGAKVVHGQVVHQPTWENGPA
jgi:Domain of unknown function (DUF5753)